MAMISSFRALALALLASSSFAFTTTTTSVRARTNLYMSEDSAPISLDPKETAFVFIEYQNEFATVRKMN